MGARGPTASVIRQAADRYRRPEEVSRPPALPASCWLAAAFVRSTYTVRAKRIAIAPPSASRPISPTSGSSLAVFGRLPDVPTGRSLSVADGGGTDGVVGAAVV